MGCVYGSAMYFSTIYVIVVMEEFSWEDKDMNQLEFVILTFSPSLLFKIKLAYDQIFI